MDDHRQREPSDTIADLLRTAEKPVRYDVERGLVRHQHLLANGAQLPAWANEASGASKVGMLRKLAPWLGAGFMLGALITWGVRSNQRVANVSETSAPSTQSIPESQKAPAHQGSDNAGTRPAEVTVVSGRDVRVVDTNEAAPPTSDEVLAPDVAPKTVLAPVVSSSSGGTKTHRVTTTPLGDAQRASSQDDTERSTVRGAHPSRSNVDRSTQKRGAPATSQANTDNPMDREEVLQLAEAERLLLSAPEQAVTLVRKGNVQFKNGYLMHERRYIEVMGLAKAGRSEEARARAQWFLRDYRSSPYREKIQQVLE